MLKNFGFALGLAVLPFANLARAQPCTAQWSNAFSQSGPSGIVYAVAQFDLDGPGPQGNSLIIGGDFELIGSVAIPKIAAWNGSQWTQVGNGIAGGDVYTLTVVDLDGPGPQSPTLFAGGTFGVSRWNGLAWDSLASGYPVYPLVLTGFDSDGDGPNPPMLVAGGVAAPGNSNVVRYNGVAWGPLGPGLNNPVRTLQAIDLDGPGPNPPSLIAGGSFSASGATPAAHIARWDGAAWSAMSSGFNSDVFALAAFDDDGPGPSFAALIAGGSFSSSGSSSITGIARWNGSAWESFGTRLGGHVSALAIADDDGPGPNGPSLIAMGGLNLVNPVVVSLNILRWNGLEWTQMASGLNSSVYAGCTWDPDGLGPTPSQFVVGGFFTHARNPPGPGTFASRIAQWDGSAWGPVGPSSSHGLDDTVYALATHFENGSTRLVVGGDFTAAGGVPASRIARWNGSTWSAMGGGFNNRVRTIVAHDEDGPGPQLPVLLAGGGFSTSGGQAVRQVAKWNGSSWTGLANGPPFLSGVNSLASCDLDGDGPNPPSLFAAGRDSAGVTSIQLWDGQSWVAVPGVSEEVRVLATYDSDGPGPLTPVLVAAGPVVVNGSPAHAAAWNGQSWTPYQALGSGPADINALCVFDDDGSGPNLPRLFAGGQWTGGVRWWNGTSWAALAQTLQSSAVYSLTAFDHDGDGVPSLFAGGSFSNTVTPPFPQVNARNIARWNGTRWSPLGAGLSDFVHALVAFDEDDKGPRMSVLYAGGRFITAGGLSSGAIARWGCGDPFGCYANCDLSTVPLILSANDFICFMNKFASADPYANCDGSTVPPLLTAGDFQCFINAFAAGCP